MALLAAVIGIQPSAFSVHRTVAVAAAAADVFTQVDDFHNRDAWSPWARLDPAMKPISVSKALCLFTEGMDRAIGPDFQNGLAQTKSVAEALPGGTARNRGVS